MSGQLLSPQHINIRGRPTIKAMAVYDRLLLFSAIALLTVGLLMVASSSIVIAQQYYQQAFYFFDSPIILSRLRYWSGAADFAPGNSTMAKKLVAYYC